jgi:hypothetical protein
MSQQKRKYKPRVKREIASTNVFLPIDYHLRAKTLAQASKVHLRVFASELLKRGIDDLEKGVLEMNFTITRK